MIEYKTGNLLAEDAEALVNTVNCVGVMGRGIALQFKKKFPENFEAYVEFCKRKEVQPGRMFVFQTGGLINPRLIINFPTKRHWRGKSRMEDIESGLKDLARVIRDQKIHSIALPPLGCGLGGLNWGQVRSRIEETLSGLAGVHITVFEPQGAPDAQEMDCDAQKPEMTAGRAALIELIHRYLGGLLDPFVTLLEVHKLMYFMQEAGEDLRLRYKQAPYGPYAENLRHVLNVIEGHFISGYADGGDQPDKQIILLPHACEKASSFLANHQETHQRFCRVSELVDGFESPFGLELLSTVHWVIVQNNADSEKDIIEKTYAWGDRKKQFSPRQLKLAVDVLDRQGWIKTKCGENPNATFRHSLTM